MEPQGIPPKKKPARSIGLLFLGVVLFFGALEGGVRVLVGLGVLGFTSEAGAVAADERLGWALTEDFVGKMGGVEVRTSPRGNRISSLDSQERSGKAPLVVWMVGDSFAFGWGLKESETPTAQLQALLPEGSVVHNLGVPGYGLTQSLIRLREMDGLESPDLVMLVANPLDFLEDWQPSSLIYQRPPVECAAGEGGECAVAVPGAIHQLIWSWSVAYRNLRFHLERQGVHPALSAVGHGSLPAHVEGVIDRFQQATQARGAKLLPVLHVPEIWTGLSQSLSTVSTMQGWTDISRNLKNLTGVREHLLRDGVHWNALAANKVAIILRAMLGKELELLEPPAGCSNKPADVSTWTCSEVDGQWTRQRKVQGEGVTFDLRQAYIPPGPGLMGPTELDLQSATASIQSVYGPEATRDYFMNETPAQVVYLDGFWFDTTEVTHEAFSWSHLPGSETLAERRGYTVAYRGKGKFGRLEGSSWRKPGWLDTRVETMANLPVAGITWGEARAHCKQLGMDLPTEAQWERAARGQDGRRYPWGDEAPSCERANAGYAPKSQFCAKRPVAVGSHPKGRSVYGVDDVAGNVFEWVRDCRSDGYYWMGQGETWMGLPVNPAPPPAVYADDCKSRMMRGGSWAFGYDAYLRAAARATEDGASMAEWGLGFRCAADLERTPSR